MRIQLKTFNQKKSIIKLSFKKKNLPWLVGKYGIICENDKI